MLWIIIVCLIIIVDQLVKYLVVKNLVVGGSIIIINKFFSLYRIGNTGVAWSLLDGHRLLFIAVTSIACIAIIYFLVKNSNKVLKLSLSLILAGAIGNLIDRVLTGSVTDFLRFDFGSYMFPIFNVADMSVVIGSAILVYYMFFIYKE